MIFQKDFYLNYYDISKATVGINSCQSCRDLSKKVQCSMFNYILTLEERIRKKKCLNPAGDKDFNECHVHYWILHSFHKVNDAMQTIMNICAVYTDAVILSKCRPSWLRKSFLN